MNRKNNNQKKGRRRIYIRQTEARTISRKGESRQLPVVIVVRPPASNFVSHQRRK